MPNPNALVDFVGRAPTPLEISAAAPTRGSQYAAITFQSGKTALLDMSTTRSIVWADVLNSLRESNTPAYVEIDPATNLITNLLAPLAVRVGDIKQAGSGGDMEVELIISHARHFLRRSNPDFEQLLQTLQSARERGTPVAVTETPNEHEIIDVRPLPSLPVAETLAPPDIEDPRAAVSAAVTLDQAQQMFNLVSGKFCCPVTSSAPCIPFNYPDDGCWGRAHEMCRLMIAAGIAPAKVWIFGNLRAASQNNPNCQVLWGWHVAPTLAVGSETYVIDPSLFPGPVTRATWASVQGDPNPTLIPSAASVFYRNQSGSIVQTDPTYTQTNSVLTTYRNALRLRSVGADGPPPYANCIPGKPGLQFVGAIAGGATHSWFTWGWPATWHMVWTIMPLTTCPGGPQLSWTVQVERANTTQATYWIVVKNLTSSAVRFEGRYDVLSR